MCHILECYKNFRKLPNTFVNFPKISEIFGNFQKLLENRFENFPTFSDFSQFPKISEDFRRFPKIFKSFQKFRELVGMLVFALSGAFSQVFQRISKHSTKDT